MIGHRIQCHAARPGEVEKHRHLDSVPPARGRHTGRRVGLQTSISQTHTDSPSVVYYSTHFNSSSFIVVVSCERTRPSLEYTVQRKVCHGMRVSSPSPPSASSFASGEVNIPTHVDVCPLNRPDSDAMLVVPHVGTDSRTPKKVLVSDGECGCVDHPAGPAESSRLLSRIPFAWSDHLPALSRAPVHH